MAIISFTTSFKELYQFPKGSNENTVIYLIHTIIVFNIEFPYPQVVNICKYKNLS